MISTVLSISLPKVTKALLQSTAWLLLLVCLALPAAAQQDTGKITVTDTTQKNRLPTNDTSLSIIDTLNDAQPSVVVKADTTATDTATTQKDTKTKKRHSPGTAALRSALVPGWGQVYNRKWWKVPIVYAGFGALTFSIVRNRKNWKTYSEAYRKRVDGDPNTIDEFDGELSEFTLLSEKNRFKRYLDISAVLMAIWYGLNIVDATVDAHLYEFDVSDDLTMRIEPVWDQTVTGQSYVGLKINLRL